MRITIISHDAGDYGASKSLLSIIEYLKSMNYDLFVIVPKNGPFVDLLIRLDINYQIIPFYNWTYPQHPVKETLSIALKNYIKRRLHALNCVISYFIFIRSIKNNTRLFKPDVVYTNTLTHPLGVILAKRLKAPHIWHIREFIEGHDSYFVFGKFIVRQFLKLSTKNIYISHALKQNFDPQGSQNSIVVPNGILTKEKIKEYAQFAKTRKVHIPIRLLSLGRISKGKRHDVAIQVLSDLISKKGIEAKLSIVGRGNINFLRETARRLNVEDSVTFRGHTDNVYTEYEHNDILIVASEMEGFGRVTVEAMATGMVVIGRNSGGTSEIIQHEKNGFLFNDEKEIVTSIENLIKDNNFASSIGASANEDVYKKYNLEQYFESVLAVLEKKSFENSI